MNEHRLRLAVGFMVIVSHLITLAMLVFYFVRGGFLFDEMTTAFAILLPIFTVYVAAILRFIIRTRSRPPENASTVSGAYVAVSVFFPLVFFASLCGLVYLKAHNIAFSEFEEFKVAIGLVEACFGGYLGLIFAAMFDPEEGLQR